MYQVSYRNSEFFIKKEGKQGEYRVYNSWVNPSEAEVSFVLYPGFPPDRVEDPVLADEIRDVVNSYREEKGIPHPVAGF